MVSSNPKVEDKWTGGSNCLVQSCTLVDCARNCAVLQSRKKDKHAKTSVHGVSFVLSHPVLFLLSFILFSVVSHPHPRCHLAEGCRSAPAKCVYGIHRFRSTSRANVMVGPPVQNRVRESRRESGVQESISTVEMISSSLYCVLVASNQCFLQGSKALYTKQLLIGFTILSINRIVNVCVCKGVPTGRLSCVSPG